MTFLVRVFYMGLRAGATTRAKTNTSTREAPARNSARVQASTVAPEVRTSSTNTRCRPGYVGSMLGGHNEGALDVFCAFRFRASDLLRRGADTFESTMCNRHTAEC